MNDEGLDIAHADWCDEVRHGDCCHDECDCGVGPAKAKYDALVAALVEAHRTLADAPEAKALRFIVGVLSNTDGFFLRDEDFGGLVGEIFRAMTDAGCNPNEYLRPAVLAASRSGAAEPPRRFDQCDDTCTVDCGHCKGAGRSGAESAAAGPECSEAFCDHDSCAKAQRDWTHAPPWGIAGAESAGERG